MKIVICGSTSKKEEKLKIKYTLIDLGHEAIIDPWTEQLAKGENPELAEEIKRDHAAAKKKYNFMKWYFNTIKESDAILVANFEKNDINGYIGANTFLEIGMAYDNNKKIFLLNNIPKMKYIEDEITAMEPIIINGELKAI